MLCFCFCSVFLWWCYVKSIFRSRSLLYFSSLTLSLCWVEKKVGGEEEEWVVLVFGFKYSWTFFPLFLFFIHLSFLI